MNKILAFDSMYIVNPIRKAYMLFIKKIKYIPILNYFDYDKESSVNILKKELGYEPYKFKHDESIITRFFQRYILLKKYMRHSQKIL